MNVSLSSLIPDRGALGFGAQQTSPSNRAGGGERPQTREDALAALVKSMTDNTGKVNGDNPLVKLLTELLQNLEKKAFQAQGWGQAPSGSVPGGGTPPQSMSPDQLMQALTQLLDMLGGGEGASAGGNGFGGGAGAAGGAGGADMLSQLLGALTQAKLDNILQPANDGHNSMTFKEGDKELLKQVANFMDQSGFPKPDDASGKGTVKSWADELNEKTPDGKDDLTLSAAEAGQFMQALKMLGDQAASGNAQASGMLANSGVPMSSGEGRGNGGGNGGGFGGGQTVTISGSIDEIRQLFQGQGGGGAQAQAMQEDARNTAGSIMNKLFS